MATLKIGNNLYPNPKKNIILSFVQYFFILILQHYVACIERVLGECATDQNVTLTTKAFPKIQFLGHMCSLSRVPIKKCQLLL